ncbi:Carbon starvation protein A [Providencia rustigianii]|nr:Carbon starvation protein A [Providencia rustigianii]
MGKQLIWIALALLGAFSLGYIALNRGEQINALWIVVAAVCIYLIAYRYYGLFIAKKVLQVDSTRMTPAIRHNDGLDYVPTDKKVLFGHHFAAIAGAGPLVGPGASSSNGIFTRNVMATGRGCACRCCTRFHGAICVHSP